MFNFLFYVSAIIFIFGLAHQLFQFKQEDRFLNPDKKSKTEIDGSAFFLNTLFQVRLFKAGKIRWVIHFLLVVSFLYLLIVHGLYSVTADLLFADYQPTLDPFQALRNVTGFFVLAGCLAFVVRRKMSLRLNQDKQIQKKGLATVVLILAVIGSGFLLEASKIISEPIFMEMVEDFSGIDDEQDLRDLKLYWEDNYSVFFQEQIEASVESPIKSLGERLENGRVLNEENCLYCHSPIRSAVVSKPLAGILSSAGLWLNSNRLDKGLYWIHYGLCLMTLICLPFSRLFHLLLIPFATGRKHLTVDVHKNDSVSINAATLQACTNCGFCSQVCSVYPNYQILKNPDVLPHSKIESVKELLKDSSSIDLVQLNTGNDACTMCHNCTDICPSGIDLQSLWTVLDKKLGQMGVVDNSQLISETSLSSWMSKEFVNHPQVAPSWVPTDPASTDHVTSNLADRIESFENCIQCTVCSNVCPIVDYDSNNIDMSPHQIMNLLRLGKKHMATGTRMVWSCLTCYACQENCPQQIQVTDILLELRNAGGVKAGMIQKDRLTEKVDQ